MKIGKKISLSFFVAALVLTSISATISFIFSRRNLQNAIFAHLTTTASSRAHHIQTLLKVEKDSIVQLSQSIVLEDLLKTKKHESDYNRIFSLAMRRLKETKKVHKCVEEFFVMNADGEVSGRGFFNNDL